MPKYEFVAVDFDGTLCADAFPEAGAPNRAVIAYVKKLAADGSKIILYTSRENGTRKLLDEAVAFCKAQGISLYAVNENPGNPHAAKNGLKHSDGRKVFADLYIDDKAVNTLAIELFSAAEIIAPELQRVSAVIGPNLRQIAETLTPHLWRAAACMRAIMRDAR